MTYSECVFVALGIQHRKPSAATLLPRKSSITYSDCVFVAFGIQHAKLVRHIILSSVACLAVQFSTLSHMR